MNISHVMTISAIALCASAQANTSYTVVPIEDNLAGNAVFAASLGGNGEIALLTKDTTNTFFNSYIYDGVMNYAPGFDILNSEGNFSGLVSTYVKSMSESGVYVGAGSAPILSQEFTNSEGETVSYSATEFWRRGFIVDNGQLVTLSPELDHVYSFSEANSISSTQDHIAGSVTTQYSSDMQELIDVCNSDELRGEQPIDACNVSLSINISANSLGLDLTANSTQEISAAVWTKNSESEWEYTTFSPLITFDEGDARLAFSRAIAVNDHGNAVGVSQDYYQDLAYQTGQRLIQVFPAVFTNQATLPILDDSEYQAGKAVDINNSNLVVGYGEKVISGTIAKQMFIHNIDSNQNIYPNGLAVGADTVPMAINEQGVVVGYGDSESSSGNGFTSVSTRQELTAFIYDPAIDAENVINLNHKISCDSPYTLVRATDINDDGTILAEAAYQFETTDSSGEPITVSTIKSVTLIPSENADICEPVVNTEGKSGSASWMIALLTLIAPFRRRLSK